jgi:hypothetical protein
MDTIRQAFVRNRTEEFGLDLWDSYILPPYFVELNLDSVQKSVVLQGGRGCGKTALLRYLSYSSQFSLKRAMVPAKALKTIGLYLKADTQYFSAYSGGDIEERKWQDVFEHSLTLALAEQIIGALSTLNGSVDRIRQFGQLDSLNLGGAVAGLSNEDIPAELKPFESWIRRRRQELAKWFRNVESNEVPELFPLREFLGALIEEIRNKLPYLQQSLFAVYIDEYENLLDYQQRFINSLIKGGEPPLIFHVAMKPNGMRTRQTIGTEAIQEVADFRKLSLDELLAPNFELFSAELFFFRLINAGFPKGLAPIDAEHLQNESFVDTRSTDKIYRSRVIGEINRILPGVKYADIAKAILLDSMLSRRWTKLVQTGLAAQGSSLDVEQFRDIDFPDASIVCAALLHQSSKTAAEVFEQFEKLRKGGPSLFKEADWIHHFLLGSILLIYLPYRQRFCPVYAGFEAFRALSKTNVRHFVELCKLATGKITNLDDFATFSISIEDQAQAAVKASRIFKEEVAGCGDHGNRLLAMVNVLGKLYRLSQGKSAQSEPERTHFCIVNADVSVPATKVLTEAVKWSVLFEEPESKVKGTRYESKEYVLNPIYAPFFGLSYNKGRKLEIPANQAEFMLTGSVQDYTALLKSYERAWASSEEDQLLLGLED